MENFYSFAETALSTGSVSSINKAATLSNAYGGQNPMRDYLYLRISKKDPFDILYLTPAVTGILNLNDSSYTFAPELGYSGITNTDIRFKIAALSGNRETEYGEKINDYKAELSLKYYF